MVQLIDAVLEAHGGIEQWKHTSEISVRQRLGGVLWTMKGFAGALDGATVTVQTAREHTSHAPFLEPGLRSIFTADRVSIENADESEVGELRDPRSSFAGHELTTPWDRYQLAYFAGYAMWTYLTEPASLILPGVATEEIDPWTEDGEKFRRLHVSYPPHIATHSSQQTLYIDGDGLIRRRDYDVDVAGGAACAHYTSEHQEFSGLVFPTRRVVYGRDENNTKVQDPVIVSIELSDFTIS